MEERLIVALDVETIVQAIALVDMLHDAVSTFKVGYWLMFADGFTTLVHEIKKRNCKLFLDAKLNDIPQTVARGVAGAVQLGADFVTVHSDFAMLEAAMAAKNGATIEIMAVTALTSMEGARDRFFSGLMNASVVGADGLIMSPTDLEYELSGGLTVRSIASGMKIATPGVRLAGTAAHDHKRSGTPAQAISGGADYIIVGRPIVQATAPVAAAEEFAAEIRLG